MTIQQLTSTLQTNYNNAQWIINFADKNNVLYANLQWLDQLIAKPSAQTLGF